MGVGGQYYESTYYRVMRKPVFRVSDQARHKPVCLAKKIAIGLKFLIKEEEGSVSKAKALISCAVKAQLISCTAQFICAFDPLFSHTCTCMMYMQKAGFLMSLLKY